MSAALSESGGKMPVDASRGGSRHGPARHGLGNRPLVIGHEGKRRICAVKCPVCSGLSREHRGIKVHDAPGRKGCSPQPVGHVLAGRGA